MIWKKRINHLARKKCSATENLERLVKRVTIISLGAAIFIMFCAAAVAGYGIYRINRAFTAVTDPDLAALEQLISKKIITLTREQKEKLGARALKGKIWSILKPEQATAVIKWRIRAEKQSGDMVQKYEQGLEKFSYWWKTEAKKTGGDIIKMLEGNQ